MNCGTKEQTDARHSLSFSIFAVGLRLKSGTDSFPSNARVSTFSHPPACILLLLGWTSTLYQMKARGGGGRAKHAQGGWSETGVSFSGGKQTHTGSRHGCHISLSSPVTPEGSGEGGNLTAVAVMPRGEKKKKQQQKTSTCSRAGTEIHDWTYTQTRLKYNDSTDSGRRCRAEAAVQTLSNVR